MQITATVIRAALPRTCTTQAELAAALGIACSADTGLANPLEGLEDVDVEAVGYAAGFRLSTEPYPSDFVLRPTSPRPALRQALPSRLAATRVGAGGRCSEVLHRKK